MDLVRIKLFQSKFFLTFFLEIIFHSQKSSFILKGIRFFVVFSLICLSNGYKILMMGPFNGKSHFLYLQHFVRALLDRGHEVTFLTSQSMSQLNLVNYTEVLIDPPFDVYALCEFVKNVESLS